MPRTVLSSNANQGKPDMWRNVWQYVRALWLPFGLLALLFIPALLAPLLATHDPDQQDLLLSLMGPSAEHWIGTDEQGRDLFSRLLFGLRLDLLAATAAVLLGFAIGTPLGLLVGFAGGVTE